MMPSAQPNIALAEMPWDDAPAAPDGWVEAAAQRILSPASALNQGPVHTYRETADNLGLTPEGVRRIEQRAFRKLASHPVMQAAARDLGYDPRRAVDRLHREHTMHCRSRSIAKHSQVSAYA